MGKSVEFPSNGHTCQGYLATPEGQQTGPAVVVIQEWWGLVPHIEDIVDRFAREGFLALAPDLYHGKTTTSPDEAGRMLMELDAERAVREIAAAGDYLLQLPECSSSKIGVIGFCMGGALAQYAATKYPDKFGALASFYGGFKQVDPEWENFEGAALLIYGEKDQGVPPEHGRKIEARAEKLEKNVTVVVYPDADHAFFNDTRPNYKPEAASDAWRRTLDLFRQNL